MGFGPAFDAVLSAAQSGAGWARTRLYEWLSPAVLGYLRAQGIPEPADATSDVFVAVLSRLHTFRGDEAHFRSWVFTIAYRRACDQWRAQGGGPQTEPLEDAKQPLPAPAAEEVALRRLGDEYVEHLLAGLTPDQREVVALRVIADLSIEQVAELLGKPPGAVKALQHRALVALRRRISAEAVSP